MRSWQETKADAIALVQVAPSDPMIDVEFVEDGRTYSSRPVYDGVR